MLDVVIVPRPILILILFGGKSKFEAGKNNRPPMASEMHIQRLERVQEGDDIVVSYRSISLPLSIPTTTQ
jgi:hypothetical protein